MDWKVFFENNINGYLLCDLAEMNKISVPGAGNCGYPMLMTMLSGMELLGGLAQVESKWSKSSSKSKEYFDYFYLNYFQQYALEYGLFKDELWFMIRHKLAHTFLTATHFKVAKNYYEKAITIQSKNVIIDVGVMLKDFQKSVLRLAEELEGDETLRSRFEKHLLEMVKAYTPDVKRSGSTSNLSTSITTNISATIHRNAIIASNATTAIPPDIQARMWREAKDKQG